MKRVHCKVVFFIEYRKMTKVKKTYFAECYISLIFQDKIRLFAFKKTTF